VTQSLIENQHINLWCLKNVIGLTGRLCGCPDCCAENGMTAVFLVEDFVTDVYPLRYWRKSVCSEKLALLCRERICPGWPGSPWKEGKIRR